MRETQVTPHFKWSEVTESDTADEYRIDNRFPAKYRENAIRVASLLETIRNILTVSKGEDVPLTINSWFRNLELNTIVSKSKTSAHQYGLAADFIAPAYGDPFKIAQILMRRRADLTFDQIIYEGRWIHIGLNAYGKPPRNQFLTKTSTGYKHGRYEI